MLKLYTLRSTPIPFKNSFSFIYLFFPTEKDDPDPVVADSDPLVASFVHRPPAQNSQREGRSLPRQGQDHLSQSDVGISAGFFTETTGCLRNTETRRTPSYVVYDNISMKHSVLTMYVQCSGTLYKV